jgi:hypothetical protein
MDLAVIVSRIASLRVGSAIISYQNGKRQLRSHKGGFDSMPILIDFDQFQALNVVEFVHSEVINNPQQSPCYCNTPHSLNRKKVVLS